MSKMDETIQQIDEVTKQNAEISQDIVKMIDRVIEKAFRAGHEAALHAVVTKEHTAKSLTFAYYRSDMADRAWAKAKIKL